MNMCQHTYSNNGDESILEESKYFVIGVLQLVYNIHSFG